MFLFALSGLTAFRGDTILATGEPADVALAVKAAMDGPESVLVFVDSGRSGSGSSRSGFRPAVNSPSSSYT